MPRRPVISEGPPLPPGRNALRLRQRLQPSTPVAPPPQRRVGAAVAGGMTVALLLIVGLAGYLYDHSRRDLIAPGVRVAGVDIGGLRVDAARQRLRARLVSPLQRPVVVHAAGRRFELTPSQAHLRVAVDALANRALRASRQGSIFSRVLHGIDGRRLDLVLPAQVGYSQAAVKRLVARVAAAVGRAPRDASVVPTAAGLSEVKGRNGVAVDSARLRRAVVRALTGSGGNRQLVAPTHVLAPKVSTAQLAGRYPAYIIIDRKSFRLRFFEHLRLANTYPIAVGRQGLETPAGLYDIQWKEVNPSWHVPNSSWAGALAGRTIPPGPQDPIKARWMAFNGGAGIHGTDQSSSLGTAASHGCIRMAIPDVIALYSRVPVHTPVFVA